VLRVAATVAFALAAVLVPAVRSDGAQASLKGWRDGPCRYLLTDEEYARFGHLEDDRARQAFIDDFWKRLDRDPGTTRNEFRETFETRCATANSRFESIAAPGWETDRGRVYILLGEPSVVRNEPGGVEAVEKEVWIYGDAESRESDLRVVFYRCMNGEYRLEPNCPPPWDGTSVALDWERENVFRRIRDSNPGLSRGRLRNFVGWLLAPVPGGMASPTPAEPRASGGVEPAAAPPSGAPSGGEDGVHALEPAAYFFRAQDGNVLVLLSLELLGSPPPPADGQAAPAPYLGAVSIAPVGGAAPDQTVALRLEPGGTPRGPALFSGEAYLQPGKTYTLRYAVKDGARDTILVRHTRLSVPDLNRGLASSSVVPAERFGPAVPDEEARHRVGSESVVPKPGAIFKHGDLLRLYFQVYDAAIDPRTNMPRVDVVFRFYVEAKGSLRRVREPYSVRGASGASLGLALPVGDWPAGAYRVSVDLKDRVGGEQTAAEAKFRIVAD
jgi:GWxTD domain-containing protein